MVQHTLYQTSINSMQQVLHLEAFSILLVTKTYSLKPQNHTMSLWHIKTFLSHTLITKSITSLSIRMDTTMLKAHPRLMVSSLHIQQRYFQTLT